MKDRLEALREELIWHTYENIVDSIRESRALYRFIIGLSVTISGFVIPLLIGIDEKQAYTTTVALLIALFLFTTTAIYGVIFSSLVVSIEPKKLWLNVDEKTGEIAEMLRDLDRIRGIEDNNTAGRALGEVSKKYLSRLSSKKETTDWHGAVFYGLFIGGATSLTIGLFIQMGATLLHV